jgi:hypothetical protein
MILCDSFGNSFTATTGSHRRNDGDIATKLNRPESLHASQRALAQGAGGHQISTTFWGRYRMGLTHRFFIALGGLNYFPEIKEFKRRRTLGESRLRVVASSWRSPGGRATAAPLPSRPLFFPSRSGTSIEKIAAKFRVGGGGYDARR